MHAYVYIYMYIYIYSIHTALAPGLYLEHISFHTILKDPPVSLRPGAEIGRSSRPARSSRASAASGDACGRPGWPSSLVAGARAWECFAG